MTVISRSTTPITDAEQRKLEAGILAAHESGDAKTLARLQAFYRGCRVDRCLVSPERPRLVGGSERSGERSSYGSAAPAVRRLLFDRGVIEELHRTSDWWMNGCEWLCGMVGTREGDTATVMGLGRWRTDDNPAYVAGAVYDLRDSTRHFTAEWELLGDLHVHPLAEWAPAHHSPMDRRAWLKCAGVMEGPWIGAVLTTGGRPHLAGWVARPGGSVVLPVDCSYDWEA